MIEVLMMMMMMMTTATMMMLLLLLLSLLLLLLLLLLLKRTNRNQTKSSLELAVKSCTSIDSKSEGERRLLDEAFVIVLFPYKVPAPAFKTRFQGRVSSDESAKVPLFLISGAHQMEPASPIQALGVNPFPSRFINRTVP